MPLRSIQTENMKFSMGGSDQ